MSKLIFDIETVGEEFDSLDETTQQSLTRWLKREAYSEEAYNTTLANIKNELGFSPLTGQIVAVGVLEYETNKGAVYFQAPGEKIEDFVEDGIKYRVMSEKEMLGKFWQDAVGYTNFVSFNGRGFDAPFIILRSAVNEVRPTKDLMSNRYLSSQKFNATHYDLLDLFSFYGSMRRNGNLHLYCRAFGIKSPKDEGIGGDDVSRLFKDKEFLKIAKYNAGDLRATRTLYEKWDKYLNIK